MSGFEEGGTVGTGSGGRAEVRVERKNGRKIPMEESMLAARRLDPSTNNVWVDRSVQMPMGKETAVGGAVCVGGVETTGLYGRSDRRGGIHHERGGRTLPVALSESDSPLFMAWGQA